MRIAFVGPLPPPLGGVAIINSSLQAIDYGWEIAAFNTSSDSAREDLYSTIGLSSLGRNIRLIINLFSFLRHERPNVVNVFVTSGPSILRDILFLMIIKAFGFPAIIHFHSKTEGEFALTPRRLRVLSYVFKSFSEKVLVLSDFHLSFFSRYFGIDNCAVLENFVRYKDYSCSIDEKSDRFLYVGRLTKEKGFYDLLEALRILKGQGFSLGLDVVGLAQSEDDESRIAQVVSDYGIGDIVHFYGAQFGGDKFDLFKKSICLVFPSRFENSPVVIKEAIAAKMSIIASDIEANRNILDGLGNSLLFQTGNPKRLADSILTLLQDRSMALRLCRASEVVTKYDESFAREKMQGFIQEVTRGRT